MKKERKKKTTFTMNGKFRKAKHDLQTFSNDEKEKGKREKEHFRKMFTKSEEI